MKRSLTTAILGLLSTLLFGCASPDYNAFIIIHNGHILTIDNDATQYENGVVVIKDEQIVAVGNKQLLEKYTAPKLIDAQQGIVMPGMINTHNHLPMIAFRGLGEEGIENRLFAYFFPLEGEKLSRELIFNATRLGTADLALSGVTTYADMYYHMDEMAKATKEVGLRAVLGQTVIRFPVVDAATPEAGFQYAINFIEEYQNDELIVPAFGPHAVYTVSAPMLQAISQAAKKYDVPVLIHADEFDNEAERIADNDALLSPVAWLNSIGVLDERMVLAHAIHISKDDMDLIAKTGAGVAYNPMANAKGATGIAPAWEMLGKDLNVGLGTDGPMSSNQVDLWRTLSYAVNMQRLKYNDRTIMVPETVIRMATMGGARALNMDDKIGSLEAGKLADIIIVETQSANMMPNYDPYATLVFQANPANVMTTIVNGNLVVEQRQLAQANMTDIQQEMEKIEADIADFAKALAIKAQQM